MSENLILRRIAELSGNPIVFKDEHILTGTAWIDGFPVDITIKHGEIHLNAVGAFGGSELTLSKSNWRGKGMFRSLVSHIKQTLIEFGFATELHLTPLSPVWEKNYNLIETDKGWKIIL